MDVSIADGVGGDSSPELLNCSPHRPTTSALYHTVINVAPTRKHSMAMFLKRSGRIWQK
jgi:hypothetical protein